MNHIVTCIIHVHAYVHAYILTLCTCVHVRPYIYLWIQCTVWGICMSHPVKVVHVSHSAFWQVLLQTMDIWTRKTTQYSLVQTNIFLLYRVTVWGCVSETTHSRLIWQDELARFSWRGFMYVNILYRKMGWTNINQQWVVNENSTKYVNMGALMYTKWTTRVL